MPRMKLVPLGDKQQRYLWLGYELRTPTGPPLMLALLGKPSVVTSSYSENSATDTNLENGAEPLGDELGGRKDDVISGLDQDWELPATRRAQYPDQKFQGVLE